MYKQPNAKDILDVERGATGIIYNPTSFWCDSDRKNNHSEFIF